MDAKQKIEAKYKLGICISKIIATNKTKDNLNLITSLRKLAAASEIEYSIIQKITSGKKDPQHTTIASIIEGFKISPTEFFTIYDSITDAEIAVLASTLKRTKKKSKASK